MGVLGSESVKRDGERWVFRGIMVEKERGEVRVSGGVDEIDSEREEWDEWKEGAGY